MQPIEVPDAVWRHLPKRGPYTISQLRRATRRANGEPGPWDVSFIVLVLAMAVALGVSAAVRVLGGDGVQCTITTTEH